ncbi:type IV secretory system conjugative DNA transfer family protein [Amycolatopsis thermoflava]|uniref:type IV secretory system conjugative DNA transfer family protein n=1 Tax=Amycolatopsis thermoflava TaxID=84480 RepID=UPI00055EA649|nr:TraM recognition domain-containing protein [Amycolatopsis thermoflava]
MRRHHTDRPVVRRRRGQDVVSAIVLGGLAGLGLLTWSAGQLTAFVTDRGWPSWAGHRRNLLGPILGVYSHPTDPMRDWPGLGAAGVPPGAIFWFVYTGILAIAIYLTVAVVREVRGGSRPGFATRREVARELGETALIKQAPRLRPTLARTRDRIRPEQMGSYLGRDVNTGVRCWASVRKSKFVVGPAESGKTACVVIPEALDHDGPLIVSSSRADVLAATWKPRSERGRVLLFDPLLTTPALPQVEWDPVAGCADPAVAIRRAQKLTSTVDMSTVSGADTWRNRGEAVLRNLLHAAALSHGDIRSVLRWAYDQTSVEPGAILSRSSVTPDSWAEMQYNTARLPDRQRAGYYMSVEAAVKCFEHPRVLATCLPRPGHGFDAGSLLDADGHTTLYVLSHEDEPTGVADLLGALIDEILTLARERGQRSVNNRLDPSLRLIADEGRNTATLDRLPNLLSAGGGDGIPTTLTVQDRAQADHRWGEHEARAMWGSATIRMVLPGLSDEAELRTIAGYAGEFDEELPSLTTGEQGRSTSYSIRTRPSLQPDEVRALKKFHSLVLAAGGLRPVLTELQPYFRRDDHALTARSEAEFSAALNDGRSLL